MAAGAAGDGTDRDTAGAHFTYGLDGLSVVYGEKLALLSERECLTYRELSGANRYAPWGQGIARGDVVWLSMPSRSDYWRHGLAFLACLRVGQRS
jgi:hypothetical protein